MRFSLKPQPPVAPLVALLGDGQVPVMLRRNARARKMILRVDGVSGDFKLTAPPHVSMRELQAFIDDSTAWLEAEHAKVTAVPPISSGDFMPFLGEQRRLVFTGEPPRKIAVSDTEIHVGGPGDQAPTRLERWLKRQAKIMLTADVTEFAATFGVVFGRVSIGDMKSRWGSCSSSGTLRFSWRLVLAPVDVRRYVAAHEVAHLLEMNHSEAFWCHVARVMPDYQPRRKWLRNEGADLMRLRFRNHQTVG